VSAPTHASKSNIRRDTPLGELGGVGARRAQRLAEAGFRTAGDLLFHLPLRYEDRRLVVDPGAVDAPGRWTVAGTLAELRVVRTRRRGFVIVRARLVGERGALAVRWFNQPFLAQRFADGDRVVAHGEARTAGLLLFELVNPTLERDTGDDSSEGIADPHRRRGVVAVYPALAGFGPAATAALVARALPALADDPPADSLPSALRARYGFPTVGGALAAVHAPPAGADLDAYQRRESAAHLRLVYEELLALQLELAEMRRDELREPKRHSYRIDDRVRGIARSLLPFKLTAAQKRVVREIVDDLRSPYPMLRLLQGDVGSGKTIVAALALLIAVESGLQGVFMAPTELLAEQQFASLRRLLGERYRVALLTSSAATAAERRALADGTTQIAVGTHALIQKSVRFARLGLAVVDEQHRFGVEQRRSLQEKGERPDVLVMTATPIPRSLALTAYGDLELSVIDELPPGRTRVATEVLPATARGEVYARVAAELAAGGRAYVVFPLIEESEEVSAASLAAMGERVRRALGGFPSAVLHGRLPAEERERIARAFARGEIKVLAATTVIEVGVDVPDASCMVIESAERFGLAQLHQLRGRVGRGARPSFCVAIHGKLSEAATKRLDVFLRARDGFEIAEADLELRGPGDLLGRRQAGMPTLRVADLVVHRAWIERAKSDAREICARRDEPEFAPLVEAARRRVPERYRALAGG
jgi:ATP-dependent DNA helicase RecG